MEDVDSGGKIERAGKLGRDPLGLIGRCRTVLTDRRVERLGLDELVRKICRGAGDARGDRHGDSRMREIGRDELFELRDELPRAFRRQIQREHFDGDEAIALLVVRMKDRAECSGADLMKDTKGTQRVGRRGAGSIRGQ